MKFIAYLIFCFVFTITVSVTNAQLYKINLNDKIDKASLIVEGKVTAKHSFWNDAHTIIYTSNSVHIYKLFKGSFISADIEVLTQGGFIDGHGLIVSDVLQLDKEQKGMFFLHPNSLNIYSPLTRNILYDVYSSSQGFLHYNDAGTVAYAPFVKYDNLQQTLYNLIRNRTGIKEKIIDNVIEKTAGDGSVNNGTAASVITSFSPASVNAGAINDPANNILTINGSGFGNSPGGSAAIDFKDANNNNTNPDFKVAYNSPYIISWNDNQIKLRVPYLAATGKFKVVLNDGTSTLSATDLQVFFAVQSYAVPSNNPTAVGEVRLMNANDNGGYTIQYSNSTKGGGIDLTSSPALQTFQRAMTTWKEIAGANFTDGGATSAQAIKDDNINLVVYDNNNTGVANMADGVLESTYSWVLYCTNGVQIKTLQNVGFDILIRNSNVSSGRDFSFEPGPCFPIIGVYDLETIFLHELGHALNLTHINDDLENDGGGYPTLNPAKLMHYALADYVDRRSPDASALQGALYEITPQNDDYGNCGLYTTEMSPLPTLAITNDECPSTFPATALQDNTTVSFDLIHATSNKFVDPSYEQVTCEGTGTSVTNNAYYAFVTGSKTDITLTIKDYTTLPETIAQSCDAQKIKLALYDVQSCPAGQSYPLPVHCETFSGDGSVPLKGLQSNHKYLLYFDGARNTKAFFNVVFNGDSTNSSPSVNVETFPNPVTTGSVAVRITNAASSSYEYALFDAVGRLVLTGKVDITLPVQTFFINIRNVASGMYFLRLVDESGKVVIKTKIMKPS